MTVGRAEVEYKYRTQEGEEEDAEDVETRTLSSTPGKVEIIKPDLYARFGASHSLQTAVVVAIVALLVAAPWYQYVTARAANGEAAVATKKRAE
jgi:hypothetical protein